MSFLSEEDSVVEAMPLPLSTPAPHPTDPFLNPRRSTTAEPTFPPPSSHSVSPTVLSLPDNTLPSPPRAPACTVVNSAERSEKSVTVAVTGAATASSHTLAGVSHSGAKRQRPPAFSTASGARSAQPKASASRSAQRPNAHTAAAPPIKNVSLSDNDDDDGDANCALSGKPEANTARGGALHDAGGGSDDDGGDGDAEEKALLEAAGAILRPTAATGGATGGTAPHPWLVTDAFHVSLWYVLRYAGAALSAADLWACRAVLLLTAARQPSGEERTSASQSERGARVETTVDDADEVCGSLDGHETSMAEAAPLNPDAWTWTGTEESELLLRLVMRKPHAFTGRHLELRYGEWLHVEPTLAALERQRFLWWAAGDASDVGVEAQEGGAASMSSAAMVEHYDGARVARLVLQGSETATTELSSVLQAVRGTELRLFLTALRHGSKLHGSRDASTSDTPARATHTGAPTPRVTADASERRNSAAPVTGDGAKVEGFREDTSEATYQHMPLGDNSVYDAVPGRKREMMRYFVERRYSFWAPTTAADPILHPPATASSSLTDRVTASAAQRGPQARRGARSSQRPSLDAASTSGAAPPPVRRCFREPGEEARLVAHFWDTHVGPVYAPHAGLKSHLVWTTEIFHVLTANGGAGAVGQQGLKPLAATMSVAAPPTLLMVRPQLLLLLQSLRSAQVQPPPPPPPSLDALSTERTPQKQGGMTPRQLTSDTQHFANSVPYALLPRWFSAPARTTSFAPCPAGFPDVSRSSAAETGAEALGEEVIATTRSFHTLDVDETGSGVPGGLSVTPPPVQLFGTTTPVLLEYRAALHTHRALYDVTEGAVSAAQRYRGRSEAFVSQMCTKVLAAVRAGVAAVKRHPLRPATPAQASEAARFIAPLATPLSTAPPSLNAMLYRWGNHVEHLLAFAPLFRWFACLELLFPLLQSARRYVEANDCLCFLLYEPVFMLHHIPDHAEETGAAAAISPITYAFRYKTHRRGEWLSRLAQNLTHLKRFPEALALLEEAQAGYHEFAGHVADGAAVACLTADAADEAATALCRVLTNAVFEEGKLPMKVQRRARLLRVLWPSCADTASLGPSLAVYHAVWEYVRDRYCRRHDRLLLEKSLAMLHRRVRQWTPLAAHRQLATRQLAEVAVWRVGGVRDAMDYMLWREPSGVRAAGAVAGAPPGTRRPALPVELFVLEHFLRKWNQPDAEQQLVKGARKRLREGEEGQSESPVRSHALSGPWYGAHCEGQWIRCLAHALLWDCYWAYPTTLTPCERPADEVHHVDHQLLWLSAFQDGPLDVTTPINFVLRRRALLARRIAELERNSREEVVRWVAAHIKGDDADASQRAHTSTKNASPQSSVDRDEEEEKDRTCDASPTRTERTGDAASCYDLADIPVEGEEDSVLLASAPESQSISVVPLAQSEVAEAGEGSVRAAPPSAVPEAWKVSVGSLPLLDILAAIPLSPLWRLLRCLYLSPVTEGVPLRFSGFPDLVFWKRSPGAEDAPLPPDGGPGRGAEEGSRRHDAPASFCLMEVKSPSDTLSTKQIAVNDMLHRCGFQVCVLRVDAVHDTGEPVSNKKIR